MKTAGTEHLIERTYRESGTFQWVRETYKNAVEAEATRIEFGIEWQAVENLGVYRRVIADNGKGMTPEELVTFFNTFGGGGKPIGGPHENFGVGAKTSLMPWNRFGVVVISWVSGTPSMIWMQHDPTTGEYGLRLEEVADDQGRTSIDEVYAPYADPSSGCDWSDVKPDWITDHGTVIVLLGNDHSENTVLGDPNRQESDTKGISSYLNRRVWDVPSNLDIYVDELRTQERSHWPPTEAIGHGPQVAHGPDRRTNHRRIRGARHYIEYQADFEGGELAAHGTRHLKDGTEIDWYLWKGKRPEVHGYAAENGFIAALYDNELYDASDHASRYRSFGVTEPVVRKRLWLIARPPEAGGAGGALGVYPNTSRNALLILGGIDAGAPLPIATWAEDFVRPMPDAIIDAIQDARADSDGGTITDHLWRDRLAERFGARWRISKLRAEQGGSQSVTPSQPGSSSGTTVKRKTKGTISRGGSGGTGGANNTGSKSGEVDAVKSNVAGGLPDYRPVRSDAIEEGMLAAWAPNDPKVPEGVVLINIEHPVIASQIEHWQSKYADIHADEVQHEVISVYGEMAVAKIAHSEHMKGIIPSKRVDDLLRSEEALTMSLLGLIGEESILAPRIGGKFGKTN